MELPATEHKPAPGGPGVPFPGGRGYRGAMPPIPSRDLRVDTPAGTQFAIRWQPPGASKPPIVLFHDSLGSVAQWRGFPERLAAATGREVVAYDRLGYGRSDPHPSRLRLDFIDDEARTGLREGR